MLKLMRPPKQRRISMGETFFICTNYGLLNELLGKSYRAWMKSTYRINDNEFIWMVVIDGKERNGWKNIWQEGKIIEQYVGGHPEPSNLYDGYNYKRRIVFEKYINARETYFVFRGIYQLEEGSSVKYRKLHCISKEFYI